MTPGCFSKTYTSWKGRGPGRPVNSLKACLTQKTSAVCSARERVGKSRLKRKMGPSGSLQHWTLSRAIGELKDAGAKLECVGCTEVWSVRVAFLPSLYLTFLPTEAGYRILTSVF